MISSNRHGNKIADNHRQRGNVAEKQALSGGRLWQDVERDLSASKLPRVRVFHSHDLGGLAIGEHNFVAILKGVKARELDACNALSFSRDAPLERHQEPKCLLMRPGGHSKVRPDVSILKARDWRVGNTVRNTARGIHKGSHRDGNLSPDIKLSRFTIRGHVDTDGQSF